MVKFMPAPLPAKGANCTTLLAIRVQNQYRAQLAAGPSRIRPVYVSEISGDSHVRGLSPLDYEVSRFMQILVRDNNVDQALRALKKKLQREGVYREMKLRRHFEKPSEKRAREKAAAVRRARKMERKRMERDGGK
jgi:small subunit ribosomal protein S21